MDTGDSGPEKAGVGGSTPSLATIIINRLADQLKISHLWPLTVLKQTAIELTG